MKPINVSVGLLAHNSTLTIAATIRSLLDQSLVTDPGDEVTVEIVVVPNGCTDNTADLAEKILKQATLPSNVSYRVCAIDKAGKTNAWNQFVHRLSREDADHLILMDSDIVFRGAQTLANMVVALEANEDAYVSVDQPVKDISLKKRPNWREWLSIRVSNVARGHLPSICGQLYCGKAEPLRRVWMPIGLPVEDGFLRAMIITERFQSRERYDRIVKAEDAAHVFEAHVHAENLFRHEEWLVASSTINTFIYDFLWQKGGEGVDTGKLIRDLNASNPTWLDDLVDKTLANKSWWVIPWQFVFRRFVQLSNNRPMKRILRFPIAVVAFAVDFIICLKVNKNLKRNRGVEYWRKATAQRNISRPNRIPINAGGAALAEKPTT